MISAFGVEHADGISKQEEIAKFGLAPIKSGFNALKGGFKMQNSVPQAAGKKSANVSMWNTGAHLGRNKKAYGAAGAGMTGGYVAGRR